MAETNGAQYANVYLRGHVERTRRNFELAEKELYEKYKLDAAREEALLKAIKDKQDYIIELSKQLDKIRGGGSISERTEILRIVKDTSVEFSRSEDREGQRRLDAIVAAQAVGAVPGRASSAISKVASEIGAFRGRGDEAQQLALIMQEPEVVAGLSSAGTFEEKLAAGSKAVAEISSSSGIPPEQVAAIVAPALGIDTAQALTGSQALEARRAKVAESYLGGSEGTRMLRGVAEQAYQLLEEAGGQKLDAEGKPIVSEAELDRLAMLRQAQSQLSALEAERLGIKPSVPRTEDLKVRAAEIGEPTRYRTQKERLADMVFGQQERKTVPARVPFEGKPRESIIERHASMQRLDDYRAKLDPTKRTIFDIVYQAKENAAAAKKAGIKPEISSQGNALGRMLAEGYLTKADLMKKAQELAETSLTSEQGDLSRSFTSEGTLEQAGKYALDAITWYEYNK